jgi:hypothetical protein
MSERWTAAGSQTSRTSNVAEQVSEFSASGSTGARPSLGAASHKSERRKEHFDALAKSDVAAPKDGRAPTCRTLRTISR